MRHLALAVSLVVACLVAQGLSAAQAVAGARLFLVDQPGCFYCERWDEEIGHIYPKTDEGRFAPIRRIDISDTPPDGVAFDRRVNFTPTFILVEGGRELARIEGYPGEDFFWGLLALMLTTHTDYQEEAS